MTSPPWLGLVPKQISTGDRTILGKISKRGNRYLRVLFVRIGYLSDEIAALAQQDAGCERLVSVPGIGASSMGRADQAAELGAAWAQAVDRGGQKAAAPQCPCNCTRQQAGTHCLERTGTWPNVRGQTNDDASYLILYLPRSAREQDEMEVRSSGRMRTLLTLMAVSRSIR